MAVFTAGQQEMLTRVWDEWDALLAAPANRAAAEAGIRSAYQAAALPVPPVIIWLDSPYAGIVCANILHSVSRVFGGTGGYCARQVDTDPEQRALSVIREQAGSAQQETVKAQVASRLRSAARVQAVIGDVAELQADAAPGQQVMGEINAGLAAAGWHWESIDAEFRDRGLSRAPTGLGQEGGWSLGVAWGDLPSCAVVDAFSRLGVTGLAPALDGPVAVTRSAGHLWWPYERAVIVTSRPGHVSRDGQGRLHCRGGMAVSYRGGWGFHAWHGLPVPAWVAEAPTMARIAAERDVTRRRCAIESLGWGQFIAEAGLEPVAAAPGQALYDMPQAWGAAGQLRLLVRANGTRDPQALIVPDWCRDPAEAQEWDAGLSQAQRETWLEWHGTGK